MKNGSLISIVGAGGGGGTRPPSSDENNDSFLYISITPQLYYTSRMRDVLQAEWRLLVHCSQFYNLSDSESVIKKNGFVTKNSRTKFLVRYNWSIHIIPQSFLFYRRIGSRTAAPHMPPAPSDVVFGGSWSATTSTSTSSLLSAMRTAVDKPTIPAPITTTFLCRFWG